MANYALDEMGVKSRTPDFFLVGQPKAGTTALYETLRQHPQIFMPGLKEPMFLAPDLRVRFRAPHKGEPILTLQRYLSLFSDSRPEQRVGEASTLYLFSTSAARCIYRLNPSALIIAIFREPTSFLSSLFLQHRQDHQENVRTLRKALALEPERRMGRGVPRRSYRPQDLLYSEHLRYTDQIARYHQLFPASQVLVLIYDDFRADNAGTVRLLLEFLGVRSETAVATGQRNPTVWVRSQLLDDAVHRLSVGRGPWSGAAKAATKLLLGASARHLLQSVRSRIVYGSPRAPSAEVMHELRVHAKPEVERLSAYIGRDLVTEWGYRGV